METKTIVRVNNVDIIATSDEQMIAIRPICEADDCHTPHLRGVGD